MLSGVSVGVLECYTIRIDGRRCDARRRARKLPDRPSASVSQFERLTVAFLTLYATSHLHTLCELLSHLRELRVVEPPPLYHRRSSYGDA